MRRRARWRPLAAALLLVVAAAPATAGPPQLVRIVSDSLAAARPNLLVFLADDLGAHDLACTGSRGYLTPAIDGLAAAGMRFTRGYAACTVCSPTRAALVTGRHPARVRITNYIPGNRRGSLLPAEYLHALPEAEVTVPELLQEAGYTTGCFGKWHLGPANMIQRHGFHALGSNDVGPGTGPPDDPMHARAIAAQAASFIERHADGPWFCYVPMHSTHAPLKARAELVAAEQQRLAALPPHAGPREVPEGDRRSRAVQDLPVYAAMVRELDETVATVLAAVERTGGIRVPLLVRWPGVVAAGTTSDVPVTTLDVAATLLDAGGVTPPAGHVLDGTSLRPLLSGTGKLPARDLVWHYPHYPNQGGRPAGALLAGDGAAPGTEKIVEHFEDGRVELFDLAADPGERHDLAAERPARAAELAQRLAAWRQGVDAAMPRPNPRPVDPYGPEGVPPRR